MRERLAVAGAAVLAHASALGGGYVWLDHGDLEAGAALAPPSRWLALFTSGYARTGFYRPATALSLSLDGVAGHPWAFRASSLAVHALVAVLAVGAAEALGLSRRAALLAGALVAVHPAAALVAGIATFRADLLVAAALLGLVAAHRAGRPMLAALAVLVAALSKETGLALAPLFVVALEVEGSRERGRGRGALLLAEASALAAALALRLAFAPGWRSPAPALPLAEAVGTRLAAFGRGATLLLLPRVPGACDAVAVSGLASPAALGGLAALAALAWMAWRRRGPAVLLALSALPALQLVAAPRLLSSHYWYLPLAFLAMLAGGQVDRLGARAVAPACAALALLGAVSLLGSRRVTSDEALFGPDAARAECREGKLYLGDARRRAGDLEGAARLYEGAAAPAPGWVAYADEGAALTNLAVVRLQQGRYAEARAGLLRALPLVRVERDRRRLVHDLAAVALGEGDAAEAARLLAPEADRTDAMPESLELLARALRVLGETEEADRLLARAAGARR